MTADAQLYGFPPGYFVIRSVATGRLWDVSMDEVEDGTEIILWPEKDNSLVEGLRVVESNNQVFFIDPSGALCSRSSGHAIDIEDECPVLRHRRPISQPFPNAYSHPLPQFSYSSETQRITVSFASDPLYPPVINGIPPSNSWRRKSYILTAVPMRKPKSLIDNASAFLTSAVTSPLSFFGAMALQPKATPEDVLSANIDLTEDETLEQDRGEDGEADDSSELSRKIRVLAIDPRASFPDGENASRRQQWIVVPLRTKSATQRISSPSKAR